MNARFPQLRYLRIIGFAAGATAVAGAAVLVTASAAGLTAGSRSVPPQQAAVESASIASIADKSSPAAICDAFLTNLTADLNKGLTKPQVNAAIQKAIGQTIDAEVTNGDITKAQGDAIKAKFAGQPTCVLAGITKAGRPGDHGRKGVYKQLLMTAAAQVLGITDVDLKAKLASGSTLLDLAAAHKPTAIAESQFRTSLIAKLTPLLDVAITNKQMTADQKAEILKRLQTGPIPYWSKHAPKKAPMPANAATT
ncbi:MAG: hypothetical protein PVSMB3_02110 [Candidatus Dormibacteraceae bacterium]